MKKTVKKKETPSQYKHYLKYLRTHQRHVTKKEHERHLRRELRKKRQLAHEKRVGRLAMPGAIGDGWILGGNDRHPDCAAVAVANSLLAATGQRPSDMEVLRLYRAAAAGPDAGASVTAVLSALADEGLCGAGPARVTPLAEGEPLTGAGLIAELGLQEAQQYQQEWDWLPSPDWGPHAAFLHDGAVVTWGRAVPVTADFLACQVTAAWRVEWGG